jgi:molybdate transport system substrate-binding protein
MQKITAKIASCLCFAAIFLSAPGSPARADDKRAPDVVVFCDPTLEPALHKVGALWRSRTGVPVWIFAAPTDLLIAQVDRNARSDIVIIKGEAASATAVQRETVKPEPRVAAWRNRLVIAGPSRGHPPSGVAPPDVDLALLTRAGRLAIADPVPEAGDGDGRAALEKLGLWQEVQARAVGAESTAGAISLMSTGQADVGLLYATDVAADPHLTVVAKVPDDAYPAIVYTVAISSVAISRETTRFYDFLRAPEARAALTAAGLEVLK